MAERITVNPPELNVWKGSPTLALNPNGRASITFGLGKAMVIRENLAQVLAFLASDGKSIEVSAERRAEVEAFIAKWSK